jgi:hypothetical protein
MGLAAEVVLVVWASGLYLSRVREAVVRVPEVLEARDHGNCRSY